MPRTNASIAHSAGDPRDQIQFSVAFNTVLTARLWRARFAEQMKALNQTDARWSVLYMVADAPRGVNQTNLAERLGIQGPTLVRLLDALESDGLIKRLAVPSDRRAKLITIEDAGRAVLAEVDKHAAKMRDTLFGGVSESDLEAAQRVLLHLVAQLDRHVESNNAGQVRPAA
jgi:MarR family transcriptional regulator, transcriptional regulator for hemolysin